MIMASYVILFGGASTILFAPMIKDTKTSINSIIVGMSCMIVSVVLKHLGS